MWGVIARRRLAEEWKAWREDHPHGFAAKLERLPDGSENLAVWHCVIPGKPGTDWEGGYYPLTIHFSEEYPFRPPKCKFPQFFFHVNVYPSGLVGLPILVRDSDWRPAIKVKQILIGIPDFLDQPNPADPKQTEGYRVITQDAMEYKRRVRQQAKQYPRTLALGKMWGVIACSRLVEERKAWVEDRLLDFVAEPETLPDGSENLMVWRCTIPGKPGTDWDGGYYPLTIFFSEEFPFKLPKCKFPQGFFHINVYPSGLVCLPILINDCEWNPAIKVKQILIGIQDFLDQPNPADPKQTEGYHVFIQGVMEYQRRVRQQAKQYSLMV